jgi:hypothetical protein
MRSIGAVRGRIGVIVPMGIATDDTTKFFFRDLVDTGSLVSIYSFENEEFVFPSVHHSYRFSLLTMSGLSRRTEAIDLVFYARQVSWLNDQARHFTLSPADFALLNPNTRTCPTFRSKRDAEIAKEVYRRVPVLVRDGDPEGDPWDISFMAMFHMASDSGLFLDAPAPDRLPLYEAKLLHQFTHRWATYEGVEARDIAAGELRDLDCVTTPRYWVDRDQVEARLKDRWVPGWLLAFRDIVRAHDVRTVIASVIPRAAVGHNAPVLMSENPHFPLMIANLNSFAFDWQARQKVGGIHLTFGLFEQLPVIPPSTYGSPVSWSDESFAGWLRPYVAELVYTASDVRPFAFDLGWTGSPFIWDVERRARMRAELDAAFFRLYGLSRNEIEHVMESFHVVRDRDQRERGSYRTSDLILESYDAMALATPVRPFASSLVPGPGDPAVAHPPQSGEAPGRWIPWADVERAPGRESVSTGGRRPDRRRSRPASDPSPLLRARHAEPQVLYPEAASARLRAAEGTAAAPAATPTQGTLADLARAAAASADWLHEDAVDSAVLLPGRRVRHRHFGEGTVLTVRHARRSTAIGIRFASGDREIAFGYGLLEFRQPA